MVDSKGRHSRKYLGHDKGMVAYTLLYHHILLNGYMIGTNDNDTHHGLDIWNRSAHGLHRGQAQHEY